MQYNLYQKQKFEIANLLLACPSMQTATSRANLIQQLPPEIRYSIGSASGSTSKEEVLSIVDACLNVEGGFTKLLEIIRFFDVDAVPVEELEDYFSELEKEQVRQNSSIAGSMQSNNVTTDVNFPKARSSANTSNKNNTIKNISKAGIQLNSVERSALNDTPVETLEGDRLGFSPYVKALNSFIRSQDTTTPLTISINGTWGSGKSSLMRMLQSEIAPKAKAPLLRAEIVWFVHYLLSLPLYLLGRLISKIFSKKLGYIQEGLGFEPVIDDTPVPQKKHSNIRKQLFNETFERFIAEKQITGQKTQKKIKFWAKLKYQRSKIMPYKYPTAWFDAWKYPEQNQLWAALAIAILDQLKNNYSWHSRIRIALLLFLRRTDKIMIVMHYFKKITLPLVIVGVLTVFNLIKNNLPTEPPTALKEENISWWLIILTTAGTAMWQALQTIKDPFALPTEHINQAPKYKEKIGFISSFEEDFARIIDTAITKSFCWKPRKFVIFIDDLDRCSPTQAAGIIEAINLFLNSKNCVFILGMDSTIVAASIESKYDKLAIKLKEDIPGMVSPGTLFLEKIVQISINIPQLANSGREALLNSILSINSRPKGTTAPINEADDNSSANTAISAEEANNPNISTFNITDIEDSIKKASNLIKDNPRQIKRFVNLAKLQYYIIYELEKQHKKIILTDGNSSSVSPAKLAIWTAYYMQWPKISHMLNDAVYAAELRENFNHVCSLLERDNNKSNQANSDIYVWKTTTSGESCENDYFSSLEKIRSKAKNIPGHWVNYPWEIWLKDQNFLNCLKNLDKFWENAVLLNNLLIITQNLQSLPNLAGSNLASNPPPFA